MKIFLAGATGAVGKRLVPLLLGRGHSVVAITRTPAKATALSAAGVVPVVVDALDRAAVRHAVVSARPDVVVHQMTALTGLRSLKGFDKAFALTNRLRTEGTDNLLAAALEGGVPRFVAQSYTGWPSSPPDGRPSIEEDPLTANVPNSMKQTLEAIRTLEGRVTTASGVVGIVLRYGAFYGPGTSIAAGGEIVEAVRRHSLPIVGGGMGIWSFSHIDDVALATAMAIEAAPAGIYNIVDDEPAPVATWLPALARTLGAKAPFRLPAWIARLAIGDAGVFMMTQSRGSSNAKSKRVLNWQPKYASWRDGFRWGLATS